MTERVFKLHYVYSAILNEVNEPFNHVIIMAFGINFQQIDLIY